MCQGNSSNWIDGKAIADDIKMEIHAKVQQYKQDTGKVPGLAVILVGNRRDSQAYVTMKKKACAVAGIYSVGYDLPGDCTEMELLDCIAQLNRDDTIHGILVQLPLPAHINQAGVLQSIDPAKDVDGLHPVNVAKLHLYSGNALEAPFAIPCTPLGCLVLLQRSGVQLQGKNCVVLGRSHLVGLPMAKLLLNADATVTVAHSKTANASHVCAQADIVVAAVGRAELVKSHWLREGAVVIDVGINSVDLEPNQVVSGGKTYKLVGDVDFSDCEAKCSKITPVPGGVGPMTITMLLSNTLRSFARVHNLD